MFLDQFNGNNVSQILKQGIITVFLRAPPEREDWKVAYSDRHQTGLSVFILVAMAKSSAIGDLE